MVMKQTDPLTALKRFVAECGGKSQAARKLGCTPQFVGQLCHGKKRVPDSIVEKLGLRIQFVADSK